MENRKEKLGIMLLTSGMGAVGFVTLICAVAGIDLFRLSLLVIMGLFAGTGGILFGVLFIANYITVQHPTAHSAE